MTNTETQFTSKERSFIDAFCADLPRGKRSGYLNAKNYFGKNAELLELAEGNKVIGTAKMEMEGERTVWILSAINGEKYRIPEPAEGIDTILELDFKRKDV